MCYQVCALPLGESLAEIDTLVRVGAPMNVRINSDCTQPRGTQQQFTEGRVAMDRCPAGTSAREAKDEIELRYGEVNACVNGVYIHPPKPQHTAPIYKKKKKKQEASGDRSLFCQFQNYRRNRTVRAWYESDGL